MTLDIVAFLRWIVAFVGALDNTLAEETWFLYYTASEVCISLVRLVELFKDLIN